MNEEIYQKEKKEVLDFLIPHYQKYLDEIKKEMDFNKIKSIILENHIHSGICYCCYNYLKISIELNEWVKDHMQFGKAYWGKIPYTADTKIELIERLELRIRKMKYEQEN